MPVCELVFLRHHGGRESASRRAPPSGWRAARSGPEIAGLDRHLGRRGEHEGVLPPLGEAPEVAVHLGGDRCGRRHQSAPSSALRGALDDLSRGEAQPLAADGDDASSEIDVASAERDGVPRSNGVVIMVRDASAGI